MRFPCYGSYIQPEADWLGELPSHWNARRTKTMFTLQNSKVGKTSADHVLLSLTLGGVIVRDLDEGGKLPAEFDTYQMVKPGDLVFCLFDIDETPRTIGISRNHGMITGAYSVYRSQPCCVPEYACYYFLHLDSFKGLRPFYTGLRKVVRSDTFSKVEMPAPPLDEQKQIAAFLDYETAKIDALIEKQQQLIALLGEKRQAVISHAVTKGVNPDAPMRDSGIECIGEVPSHWNVGVLKRFATVNTGVAKGKDLAGQKTVNVPYLRVANVQDGYLDLDEVMRIDILEREVERYRLRAGDVLMNEGGDFDKLGRGHVWEGQIDPCITQNHVFAVRPTGILSQWLSCITSSHYAQFYFKTRSKQSTNLASISSTNLMQLPVVVPPKNEQNEILGFIKHSTAKFDGLLAIAEETVGRLQERRAALISAAVTGKIDVRGWKRPSPTVRLETEIDLA